MAIITLRVEDVIKNELDTLATDQQISLSELLRRAVDTVIGRATDPNIPSRSPHVLTLVERATLALLYEIRAKLEDDNETAEHHVKMAEVLKNGYTAEYGNVFYALERELSREQCEFVWDVLDLFRTIRTSLTKYTEEQRSSFSKYEVEFEGFDLNSSEEAPLLDYARYLIANHRWTDLEDRLNGENGNSHHSTIPRYRALVARWRQILNDKRRGRSYLAPDDYLLSPDELETILDAGRLGEHN